MRECYQLICSNDISLVGGIVINRGDEGTNPKTEVVGLNNRDIEIPSLPALLYVHDHVHYHFHFESDTTHQTNSYHFVMVKGDIELELDDSDQANIQVGNIDRLILEVDLDWGRNPVRELGRY